MPAVYIFFGRRSNPFCEEGIDSALCILAFFLIISTRSTIEVAHFRYFVSERRGSLTPNRRNVNIEFEKKRLVDLGHGIIRRDAFDFC